MEDAYKVNVECGNCGWYGELEIAKGVMVKDAKCAHCGCAGVHRYVLSWLFKTRIRIGENGEKIYTMTKSLHPVS